MCLHAGCAYTGEPGVCCGMRVLGYDAKGVVDYSRRVVADGDILLITGCNSMIVVHMGYLSHIV